MSKKILIIDDEADVRAFLAAVLRKKGYQILFAENGAEGLEVTRRERPDLITLDVMMPRRSGMDFYRNLRKDEQLNQTPIIVVSAMVGGADLSVLRPDAIFDKPIDPASFVETVERVLA